MSSERAVRLSVPSYLSLSATQPKKQNALVELEENRHGLTNVLHNSHPSNTLVGCKNVNRHARHDRAGVQKTWAINVINNPMLVLIHGRGVIPFFSVTKTKKGGGGVKWHGTELQEEDEWSMGRKNVLFELFSTFMAFFFVWNVLFLVLIGRVRSGGEEVLPFVCEAQRKGVKIRGDSWPLRSTPTPRVGFGIHNQLILNAARRSSGFLGSLTVARASSWSDASSVRLGSTAEPSGGYREASHRYTR